MVLLFHGFIGFIVLWFYCVRVFCCIGVWFMVLWFYSFIVLWLYGFTVPKNYRSSISCFQEAIDAISKIFQILLDGSSGLVGDNVKT